MIEQGGLKSVLPPQTGLSLQERLYNSILLLLMSIGVSSTGSDNWESDKPESRLGILKNLSGTTLLFAGLLSVYAYFFLESLPLWFHPGWTTDDALQQWFPLHEVLTPGIFSGDLIYEAMSGYLAPLHYWVCVLATYLTGDLIVASHWVMLIQLTLSVGFLFLAVRVVGGTPAALFSVFWLLHTRQIVQRLTAGLPRGWSAVVITAFCYFAFKKNHKGVLVVLFLGCLSHPPTTLICAGAYGLWLVYEVVVRRNGTFRKPLLILLVLSPLFAFTTFKVVERSERIGQMVSFQEASESPQFQFPDGRFPFLPHPNITDEWHMFAFQAFTGRFYKPAKFFRKYIRELVVLLFGVLLLVAWRRKIAPLPTVLSTFFVSVVVVYLLSRPLAFKLYVPNRHLQFPLAMFWIMAFPVLTWRVLHFKTAVVDGWRDSAARSSWLSTFGLLSLLALIFAGGGDGLTGSANFNYSTTKKGNVFVWAEKFTTKDSVFAGHPKLIDGMMLFGKRKAYATNETYHPFYPTYRTEIERRLGITFRAHYAQSLSELYDILAPEGIDYFVFDRKKFYPESLKSEKFYPPLDELVKSLTDKPADSYAYKQLPSEVNLEEFPPLVFRDEYAAVVDLKALGAWLKKGS